jgi:hypothetical protein
MKQPVCKCIAILQILEFCLVVADMELKFFVELSF